MTKTLVLMFHPDPARSTANAALARAAAPVEGVEVIDMAAGRVGRPIDMMRDDALEAERLFAADRIVLQFPMQWYSMPAFMKDWIDAVLLRLYYLLPQEGTRLAGTPLMLAVTTGAVPEAFSAQGQAGFTMAELLAPLRAMARRCALPWHEPFVLHGCNRLSEEDLHAGEMAYQAALRAFIAATPAGDAKAA